MNAIRWILALLLACWATDAAAQAADREPHIGYLYPAGGRRGQTVMVTVGGQFIRDAKEAIVSGEGVRARVIDTYRPVRNINKDQRLELQWRMQTVRDARLEELAEQPGPAGKRAEQIAERLRRELGRTRSEPYELPEGEKPVEHPLLHALEDKSLRELRHVVYYLRFPRGKLQLNTQIGETALLEVTIAEDAAPGDRWLCLASPRGMTNRMLFEVGQLPETCELETNAPGEANPLPPPAPLELPVVLNGQVMPGDIDRFRIRAREGQQLVLRAQARRLVPYLADAVPGWFQATLALYDDNGREVAFADDFRIDPDPVLHYRIPADGIYEVEIRDAIYRGREDFVYRIAVGELPFITHCFPLGARQGAEAVATVEGWNLDSAQVKLDTRPGADVRNGAVWQRGLRTNEVMYAIDDAPEALEAEPNDALDGARRISPPLIVNGRIDRPGDIDVFRVDGRAGQTLVAEIHGRRLRSPIDSLLRLLDADGNVVAFNDDFVMKDGHLHTGPGWLTHYADSRVQIQLPADGACFVQVSDAQGHGGPAYGYRLHIGPASPDFALHVAPSTVNVVAGRTMPLCVHVLREDGFAGPVDVELEGAPRGFHLHGGHVPGDCGQLRLTLTAPNSAPKGPLELRLVGRADIGGRTVKRRAQPADDMMQAFLWRHLLPAEELVVHVQKTRWTFPEIQPVVRGPLRLAPGASTELTFRSPARKFLERLELELTEAPAGVTLGEVRVAREGLVVGLNVDPDAAGPVAAGNLIVEAFTQPPPPRKGNGKPRPRVSLGVLPAVPYEVVRP